MSPTVNHDLEDSGIVSYHLLLEEVTGSSNPAISHAIFIPEGARLQQVIAHIFPTATTSIKFEVPQNPINHGPNANDRWYPLNNASGQITEDMAQKEARTLHRTEYDVVKGWIRLVTGAVAANSRYWVELKVKVPYWRGGPRYTETIPY
jgi:hypothetical protein